jgi:thiol-disulfide isomerase/thioredoxin
VRNLRSGPIKRLLHDSLAGQVVHGADVLQLAILALMPMQDDVQVPDRVVGTLHDSRPTAATRSGLAVEGELPSLSGAIAWLNSPPLTSGALRGKVVLVQFWTYTCINWRRTLPYVRAWSEKYKDKGLVVIGVHTPEFEF